MAESNASKFSSKITSDGTIGQGGLAAGVGGIDWQSVFIGDGSTGLTAVAGRGYFIDTTSGTVTVTLPASASVGDQIIFSDYARTWGTNAVTINQNSLNFQGYTSPNPQYNTSGQSVKLIYSGATQGWIPTVDDDVTFETPQSYSVDFLVIAGGGSGGHSGGAGGGGAGGYRTSYNSETSGGGASAESALGLSPGTTYTITVGAGGASQLVGADAGNDGNNSSISGSDITDIISTGGGGGGAGNNSNSGAGNNGGSGGGESGYDNIYGGGSSAGSGTANQGYDGGNPVGASGSHGGGGGGGAGAVGGNGSGTSTAGNGGNGLASTITGSSVTRGGGGGAGIYQGTRGLGGSGGGGNGYRQDPVQANSAGTANQGGGGGGSNDAGTYSNAGGSGVVILRMADADYSGTTTGSPTVNTNVGGSGETVLIFNASGSYTA